METSTKKQTLHGHSILHKWFGEPNATNWTKDQIIDEHTRMVKKIFDFNMEHNIVDDLDKTLPKYLKSKSNKEE